MNVRWLSGGLTEVPGVRVGQVSSKIGATGVTAILFDRPSIGGSDVRGGAASTRQFGSLDALHVHGSIHAVVFAGGSAFGLESATGAVRFLEERGIGLPVLPGLVVPVVPTAIILDLGVILPSLRARPDAAMGYAACEAASAGPVEQGSVGAGTGAAIGKCTGITRAMKGGVGSVAAELPGGGRVGALVVVNAFGDVIDPDTGGAVAGLREAEGSRKLASSAEAIVDRGRIRRYGEPVPVDPNQEPPSESTTLSLVVTDVPLTRVELTLVARLAGHGMVRAISPCHTILDGDVVVTAGTSGKEISLDDRMSGRAGPSACVDATAVGLVAAEAVARAVIAGVRAARGVGGMPGLADW